MTSARRPYSQLSIAELEQLTQDVPERRATNEAILAELRYRSTARAQRLQRRIERLLDSSAPIIAPPPRKTPERAVSAPMSPKPATRPTGSLPGRTTATNQPQDILRAWTVLEVLSPATFRKPADLAGGDMRRIARFDRGLPWSGSMTKGPPRGRLYFQIVLGSIAMQPAIDQLLQRFADSRPEKHAGAGRYAIGSRHR